MKRFLGICLIIACMGCATAYKINSLSPGLSKSEVIQKMGAPTSTAMMENAEYLTYQLYDNDDKALLGIPTDYYVRLINGKVESFGRKGDFGLTRDPTLNINSNNKYENAQSNDVTNTDRMYSELKKLKQLLDDGIITKTEFDLKKAEILQRYK